ncbi:MurR/RpiR family transcriptional regulator [Enterococcus massiliensis]|uniref:MurR/RpiR family transcriptional regulator n=1 Tax=Enterococcus massiliensis TaxID=1640685 RepID=UPI00065E1DB9|nr:MurR/RpiR family transcriptional regulator [Enterococcus massiliensis]
MYFYELLKKNRHLLNDNEEQLLSYFLDHATTIQQLTIRDVAKKFFTAPNTITRMCKKLGFIGYSDFKEALYITTIEEQSYSDFTSLDDQLVRTKQLLNLDTLAQINKVIFEAEQILILGVGLSRLPSEELHNYLSVLGKKSQIYLDPHLMRHAAKKLTKNDVVIAFSISEEIENIINPVHIAKVSGATTVSITGFSQNQLSKITDYQLYGMTSRVIIDGIDVSDRLSFHYLVNKLFTEYLKTYYSSAF